MINTTEEALSYIASLPKGEARKECLKDSNIRKLVHNTGAGIYFYCTKTGSIEDTNILLLKRHNPKANIPDGLGSFGGLCERTSKQEWELSKDKTALIDIKDDVIMGKNGAELITDEYQIAFNNIFEK